MTENALLIRPFLIQVRGFDDYVVYARTRSKAMYQTYLNYSEAWTYCTFREFMRICRCVLAKPHPDFGKRILVQGKPAFLVPFDDSENYPPECEMVRFVYPDGDKTFISHPIDVTFPEKTEETNE